MWFSLKGRNTNGQESKTRKPRGEKAEEGESDRHHLTRELAVADG
jgi:hypothetical protein